MKRTAIIFDTETTGLLLPNRAPLEKQPRIIELGALKIDHTGEIGSISQLINPDVEISPTITKITGITQEQLTGMPSFVDFLPQLKEFFTGVDTLIAHNCPFDAGMLTNELLRAGCEDFPWPPEKICTVQEYLPLFGHRPKLTKLYEKIMGEPLMQTHRALDDVMAVHAVLIKDNFFDTIDA
jgi:DNA polymerase III epsilon subunit-like protein